MGGSKGLNLRKRFRTVFKHQFIAESLFYIVLIGASLVVLSPFAWLVSTSLKTKAQVFSIPPQIIPNPPMWRNYLEAWKVVPFGRFLLNSLFVTTTIIFGQLISCSLGAYAFSRFKFRGRDILFFVYLATLMIPIHATIVPTFVLIKYLGWTNSYAGLIAPFFFGSAYGTFLLRQFFMTIPDELEDAARIDGLGSLRILFHIVLPLSKPALAALVVLLFTFYYNQFIWPLVVISSKSKMPITLGLAMFQGIYITDWGLLMSGTLFALLPVITLFIAMQKYFIQGIALTGLKA